MNPTSKSSPQRRKFLPIPLNLEEDMRFLNSLTEEEFKNESLQSVGSSNESKSRSSDESKSRSIDDKLCDVDHLTVLKNSSIISSNCSETKPSFGNSKELPLKENKGLKKDCDLNTLISCQTPKNKQHNQQFFTPTLKPIKENGVSSLNPKIHYRTHISSIRTPVGSDVLRRHDLKHESTPRSSNRALMGPPNSVHKDKENTAVDLNVLNKLKTIIVNGTEYFLIKELGRGGSSIIYHCIDFKSCQEYAIKCVNLNNDSVATSGIITEVKTLNKLRDCDRIIKMFDYQLLENEKKLYVILEKGNKNLSEILNEMAKRVEHFPMYQIVYFWMEMLLAVKQIHSIGVVHSDLKPANFVQVDGKIKLIDFGLASCIQNDMTSIVKNVALGTFNYISPEALCNQKSTNLDSPNYGKSKFKLSCKSDVWSLGCILYRMVYRKTPFEHIGHVAAKLHTIMDPNHTINYPKADWVKPGIINTIKSCLRYNKKERPSIDELISENF